MESKTSSSFQGDCQAFRRFEWIYSGTPLNGRPSTADTIIVGRKLYGQVDQGVGQVDQGLGQVFHIVLVKLWEGAVVCLWVTLASLLQSWTSPYLGQSLLILGVPHANCFPRQ